jgi:hypothetical protein
MPATLLFLLLLACLFIRALVEACDGAVVLRFLGIVEACDGVVVLLVNWQRSYLPIV